MALLAIVVVGSELSHGVMEAGRRFLANRWTKNPEYYAVGILGFIGISACLLVAKRFRFFELPLHVLAGIGSQSLFIYGMGNLWLNLLPIVKMSNAVDFCVVFLFLSCLIALGLLDPRDETYWG